MALKYFAFPLLLIIWAFSQITVGMSPPRTINALALEFLSRDCSFRNCIPIRPIFGTKLYTGIFYKIGMKKFPQGWVTWTDTKTEHGGNFVQIDNNSNNLPHYQPGGKWEKDIQWVFAPTGSKPEWYTLTNRGVPRGVATWSYKNVRNSKDRNHIILSRKPEDVVKLSRGGEWYNDSLWAPVGTTVDGNYQLVLKAFPGGVISRTQEKYGDYSHYIQVNTKAAGAFETKDYDYDDTIFTFSKPTIQFDAKIEEFRFMKTQQPSCLTGDNVKTLDFATTNPSLEDRVIKIQDSDSTGQKNQITLTFDQPLGQVHRNLKISNITLPWFADIGAEAGFQPVAGTQSQSWSLEGTSPGCTYNLNVPAHSSVQGSVICKWVQDFEIPFVAKMKIYGKTDRMSADRSGIAVPGPVPSELIEQALPKYTILYRNDDSGLVVAQLTGILKGSFGLKTKVITKEIPLGCPGELETTEIGEDEAEFTLNQL